MTTLSQESKARGLIWAEYQSRLAAMLRRHDTETKKLKSDYKQKTAGEPR